MAPVVGVSSPCVNTRSHGPGPPLEAPCSLCFPLHDLLVRGGGWRAGKERRDSPTADPFGISILLLLLLQDVALSPFLDDKKVIHAQGRDPIPSLTDSATVK